MKKELNSFIFQLLALSAILTGVHYYIFHIFFSEINLSLPLWSIYLFNIVLVIAVFGIIFYKTSKGGQSSYTIFLVSTLIKMALAIVFLLPLFVGKSENSVTEVINFFIPYFIFLAFEIYSLNKFFKNQ
ncbi:MAG: hypothetical protein ACJAX7_002156 [Saprospiraceae bacterium]|jgi:hypothetical protein|uniref:hypothetical protein n=1 Tax=Candidatus Marifrigoribacter sp. Uisw_064 TaxID=3230970 RepID=UPI003AEB2053